MTFVYGKDKTRDIKAVEFCGKESKSYSYFKVKVRK